MSVLKIKDQNGNWIQIPTIKGEDGQDYVLTESDKQEIADLVDAPVEDVQIEGTSIINDGVVEIPKASYNNLGIIKTGNDYGIASLSNGRITVYKADDTQIKNGEGIYRPIVPSNQHESTFYGLAKASGDTTQAQSNNAVGTYTDEAKASIQSMLGVANKADKLIVIIGEEIDSTNKIYQIDSTYLTINNALTNGASVVIDNYPEIFPYVGMAVIDNNPVLAFGISTTFNGTAVLSGYLIMQNDTAMKVDQFTTIPTNTSQLTNDSLVEDVQIRGTSIVSEGVADIPIGYGKAGLIRISGSSDVNGLYMNSSTGATVIHKADDNQVKAGTMVYRPITPSNQHSAAFYGLAKASGDTTQSQSDNEVGTYTDGAKTAIQTMLGVPSADDVVTDVQVNGTSIVTNGTANVPIANGQNTLGLTQYNSTYGVTVNASGRVQIFPAISSEIKGGTNDRRPITPSVQNEAVFYGLAKAAGDTTQSSSSNTVGTYTDGAKTAIKQMLDIKDDYDSLVVEVSGTDPIITGKPSYRYNCGELYTLSVTPPASGTMDIIFTSGTTPTVLTLPNTVKMPDWWAGIETNTTYEMCITDGTYCGVMSWAT